MRLVSFFDSSPLPRAHDEVIIHPRRSDFMARTRSTRKTTARSPTKKTTRNATTRGRPAAKKAATPSARKTAASSRGTAKAKASSSQAGDGDFRTEVQELVEKLTTARRPWSLRKARQEFERSYVNHIIRRSDMDRQRAASRLDIGFSTLKEKIRAPGKR
jgi:DNA-binding NtrC family response regulator